MAPPPIRNIAIIAHVDHGKTTLVDGLLRQSGTVAAHERMAERAMDSMDLEQERGITILSKATSVRHGEITINIVDTPGHSDFGGEVERVLSMVDSVLLLVDAREGPMPQTRFVLRKALGHGLRPIVVINKVDRADARPDEVLNFVFDLFVDLEANEEQLDFPVLWASAKEGWAVAEQEGERLSLAPLLDAVVEHAPPPDVDAEGPFQMQPATISYNDFVGRIAVGRVHRGRITKGEVVACIAADGVARESKVTRLIGYQGLREVDIAAAVAGDIVGISGVTDVLPGETFCAPAHLDPLPLIAVEEPTVSVELLVNDGPLAGTEGTKVTSRNLLDRLSREAQSNVALRVELTDASDVFRVAGRGELHLCVLVETMRREGYEMMVSMPRVIIREGPGGKEEPYEDVTVECEEACSGAVIKELNQRGGELQDMRTTGAASDSGSAITRLEYRMPTRGLIGYRSLFLTQTRGTGTMYHSYSGHGPWKGPFQRRSGGVICALTEGRVTSHALETLQDRGILFIEPGDRVYGGQIVGEHARAGDLPANPTKLRKLDNMRSSTKEIDVRLNAARRHTLEEALEFINEDELVEVTPDAVRLRKRILDAGQRKRLAKANKVVDG